MAHPRRRYAGAVALAGTFAACLARPHASTGSGDSGANGGDGSVARTRCDSPVAIDSFDTVPAGCVKGTISASINVSNGSLSEQGSNNDDPVCTWSGLPGFGAGFIVQIRSVAVNGAPDASGEIQVTTSLAGTVSFGFEPIAGTMVYEIKVNGNVVGNVPVAPYFLLIGAPDDHTIVLDYSQTFDPNLQTWTFVTSKAVPAGTTNQSVDVKLALPVRTSSFASATFQSLQLCP